MTQDTQRGEHFAFRHWKALNGQLTIDFEIDTDLSQKTPTVASINSGLDPRTAETVLIYPDHWSSINLLFDSGVRIIGRMVQRNNVDIEGVESVAIFVDIQFGHIRQENLHFEGVIVFAPVHEGPIPPSPPVPPGPSDQDDPVSPVTRITGPHEDLFPYVFVRQWSALDRKKFSLAFIEYGGASDNKLLLALKAATSNADRQKIAMDFVGGQAPYQKQFLWDLDALDNPVARFPDLAETFHRSKLDPQDWLVAIEVELLNLLEQYGKPYDYFASKAYLRTIEKAWSSYFALVVLNEFGPELRDNLARILWFAHVVAAATSVDGEVLILRDLGDDKIIQLHHAIILLPGFFSDRASKITGKDGSWALPYAIGDLQMVRHHLAGYAPGEIARIENVMPGERREVRKRKVEQQIDKEEFESDVTSFLQADADDERTSLQRAAQRLLGERKSTRDYKDFDTTYGPPTTAKLNGKAFKTITHEAPGRVDDVTRFARKILNKSVESIGRNIRQLRSRSALARSEELVSSVIDNTNNKEGILATYRWIDKVYEARVINYGRRLMMEFSIAHPAKNYIAEHDALSGHDLRKPKSLAAYEITSFEDITPENYSKLCADFDVTEVLPPPPEHVKIGTTLRGDDIKLLTVPAGYRTIEAIAKCTSSEAGQDTPTVMVGTVALTGDEPQRLRDYTDAMPIPVSSALPVPGIKPLPPIPAPANGANQSARASAFSLPGHLPPEQVVSSTATILTNVEIHCRPTGYAISEWKISVYRALSASNEKRRQKYYQQVENSGEHGRSQTNPGSTSEVERTQLKARCIDLLLDALEQEASEARQLKASPPNADNVYRDRSIQFLESAIEWHEMSFRFSPSPSKKPGNSADAKDYDDGDRGAPFTSFLQAKEARILVPVRPDYLRSLILYWSTGEIWQGPQWLVPTFEDDAALIVDAGDECEAFEERGSAAWKILVPTQMQAIDNRRIDFFDQSHHHHEGEQS